MKNCTLYIVRHGETDWNAQGLVQGHTDRPLNETGKKQAQELGNTLKDVHFEAAFSSDLLRAKQTAEIIALEHKLAVEATKVLREQYFGKLEGMHFLEFRKLFREYDDLSTVERVRLRVEDMETAEEAVSRLITFLREISIGYAGKNVLVVCHGGLMRHLIIHLGLATYKTLVGGGVKNLATVILESDGVDFFVKKLSGVEITV
jgi:broad specificity phosphatase PhoE